MTRTEEGMALIEPVEKQAGGDRVREMLAFAAERIMEIEGPTGAALDVREDLQRRAAVEDLGKLTLDVGVRADRRALTRRAAEPVLRKAKRRVPNRVRSLRPAK